MSAASVRSSLRAVATPARARSNAWFFKTAPGQYGHGDRFLGCTVPQVRAVAKRFRDLPLADVLTVLKSPWHEERLCALILLGDQFRRAKDASAREAIVKAYLRHLQWVNNWDLVDGSAGTILGVWLRDHDRAILDKLVRSKSLWERRVAIIATQGLINAGESEDALRLSELLLGDKEDLMHKASGWMLREVGKRVSPEDLRGFLSKHAAVMPRTMLRYAIERFSPAERKRWMGQKVCVDGKGSRPKSRG